MTSAVTRPIRHVAAVRADAEQAARAAAARTGGAADSLITDTIDWALGQRAEAPFSQTPAPSVIRAAEIGACRRYLETTPWRPAARDQIGRARDVAAILEWLSGETDRPPVYTAGTQPGDLVGGRGPVVRSSADITAMTARARAQAAAGDTAGWESGPGWRDGRSVSSSEKTTLGITAR